MQLRGYQHASIEALRQGFRDGHTRQVLCASTGSGKSIIMLAMIQAAIEKGSRIGFICERRILADQFSKHLDHNNIEHGVLMSKHYRYRPHEKVQVISAQTMERMDTIPVFDIVFIDEIHACLRKSIMQLMTVRPKMKVIGATATPFHAQISKYFESVTNIITMRELVDGVLNEETGEIDKFLLPFRVFIAHEIDTSNIKVVAGEWAQDEVESKSLQIVGDVVSDYLDISQRLYSRNAKAICFSAGIAHGRELVTKFAESGVNAVQLTCDTPDEIKVEILKEFSRYDTDIDILISADLLTRGYDETSIEHVILAKPLRKSFSNFVQMIGRGARPHEGLQFCSVQDNSGNWLRFKDQWDELYSEGVKELQDGGEKKPKKELTEKEKKAVTCPRCKALMASDVCSTCGYVHEKKVLIETIAGEMLELAGNEVKREKFTPEFKQRFFAEMLHYERAKGKKENWAAHKHFLRFKHWPDKKQGVNPINPSAESLAYLKYLNIQYIKGKR